MSERVRAEGEAPGCGGGYAASLGYGVAEAAAEEAV